MSCQGFKFKFHKLQWFCLQNISTTPPISVDFPYKTPKVHPWKFAALLPSFGIDSEEVRLPGKYGQNRGKMCWLEGPTTKILIGKWCKSGAIISWWRTNECHNAILFDRNLPKAVVMKSGRVTPCLVSDSFSKLQLIFYLFDAALVGFSSLWNPKMFQVFCSSSSKAKKLRHGWDPYVKSCRVPARSVAKWM